MTDGKVKGKKGHIGPRRDTLKYLLTLLDRLSSGFLV